MFWTGTDLFVIKPNIKPLMFLTLRVEILILCSFIEKLIISRGLIYHINKFLIRITVKLLSIHKECRCP